MQVKNVLFHKRHTRVYRPLCRRWTDVRNASLASGMICTGIARLSCQVQLAPASRTRSESRKVGRGNVETFWGRAPANLPISDINEDAPQ